MTRIIAGSAGGRRLRTPAGQQTRPTSDRVREALFSALSVELGSWEGVRFLDLYAGSGAVGLEALSRGAAALTAVEHDRRTADLVRSNAAALGWRPQVVTSSVRAFLQRTPAAPYHAAYVDPPYASSEAEVAEVLETLASDAWTVAGAMVVVERSVRGIEPNCPDGLVRLRSKAYGETVLWYFRADRDSSDDLVGD